MNMKVAAARSAAPMPICTFRFDHRHTMPAPSQAPSTAAMIIENSVRTSTGMIDVKMNACTTVGRVWPTLRVPGMMRSGTIWNSLNTAVVVANEPMPSASKKFVTAPSAIWPPFGAPMLVACEASGPSAGPAVRAALIQPNT
jgi:hypothetical protein